MSTDSDETNNDVALILSEYERLGAVERETTRKSMDSLVGWIVERFQVTVLKAYEILPDFLARLTLIMP